MEETVNVYNIAIENQSQMVHSSSSAMSVVA